MNFQTKLFFLFALAFCLPNCQNAEKKVEKKDDAPTAGDAVRPRETPSTPETYLYLITMDKYRLRDQPSQQGKVVHQFGAGEYVEGTGKTGKNEQVDIGGETYDEPWFEVVSTTPDQNRGWIYGAGTLRVYAGARQVSPDLGKLSQFSMFLKNLDTRKIDSGAKAWQFTRANFSESRGTLADAAFLILENYLHQLAFKAKFPDLEKIIQPKEDDWNAIRDGEFDMSKTAATRQLDAAGFRLDAVEGTIISYSDMRKIEQFFVEKVTPPMKNYLQQLTREQKKRDSEDGGIIIELDELAARAIFWENFNQQHPFFVAAEQCQNFEKWKRWSCINGMDNTGAFDYETGLPTEDFSKMWGNVLQKYPGSKLARTIKELQDLMASEGGKRGPKVQAFQEKIAAEAQ